MANMLYVVAVLSVFLCSAIAQDLDLLGSFDNFILLNTNPQYGLYWTPFNASIKFAVHVETTGWVGLGISPDGLMPDSDVIMGFVDDFSNQTFLSVSRCWSSTHSQTALTFWEFGMSTFFSTLYC